MSKKDRTIIAELSDDQPCVIANVAITTETVPLGGVPTLVPSGVPRCHTKFHGSFLTPVGAMGFVLAMLEVGRFRFPEATTVKLQLEVEEGHWAVLIAPVTQRALDKYLGEYKALLRKYHTHHR